MSDEDPDHIPLKEDNEHEHEGEKLRDHVPARVSPAPAGGGSTAAGGLCILFFPVI